MEIGKEVQEKDGADGKEDRVTERKRDGELGEGRAE